MQCRFLIDTKLPLNKIPFFTYNNFHITDSIKWQIGCSLYFFDELLLNGHILFHELLLIVVVLE